MKKLLLALIVSLFGLAITDVFAGGYYRKRGGYTGGYAGRCYDRCYDRCERTCPEKSYACPQPQPCKFDKVEEEPCPAIPCCTRYVKVEEPAIVTKHINYSVSCPAGCTEEQKDAGMMKAGETWDAGKTASAAAGQKSY